MKQATLNKIKWTARIISTLLFIAIFPFYIGYGIPLPNNNLMFIENLWLIIMPIMLIGLLIGWKWEKLSGYILTTPIIIGFLAAIIIREDISPMMAIAIIPGILYLIYGYKKNDNSNTRLHKAKQKNVNASQNKKRKRLSRR